MHSISTILTLSALVGLGLGVAMPAAGNDGMPTRLKYRRGHPTDSPGHLAPRDFSIVITDTQNRLPAQNLAQPCDDAKCNELCYQRGGFVGGSCGDSGKCDCVEPPPATDPESTNYPQSDFFDFFFGRLCFVVHVHADNSHAPVHYNVQECWTYSE